MNHTVASLSVLLIFVGCLILAFATNKDWEEWGFKAEVIGILIFVGTAVAQAVQWIFR